MIGACSLLTSMRDLGSKSAREDCSASPPKHSFPSRAAVDWFDGKNSEGEADEPGASVGKDALTSEDNFGVKQGAVKLG